MLQVARLILAREWRDGELHGARALIGSVGAPLSLFRWSSRQFHTDFEDHLFAVLRNTSPSPSHVAAAERSHNPLSCRGREQN